MCVCVCVCTHIHSLCIFIILPFLFLRGWGGGGGASSTCGCGDTVAECVQRSKVRQERVTSTLRIPEVLKDEGLAEAHGSVLQY